MRSNPHGALDIETFPCDSVSEARSAVLCIVVQANIIFTLTSGERFDLSGVRVYIRC